MKVFVEIPTTDGSVAVPLHDIDRVERQGDMTMVLLYRWEPSGNAQERIYTALTVAQVLGRMRRAAAAAEKAMKAAMGG